MLGIKPLFVYDAKPSRVLVGKSWTDYNQLIKRHPRFYRHFRIHECVNLYQSKHNEKLSHSSDNPLQCFIVCYGKNITLVATTKLPMIYAEKWYQDYFSFLKF